MVAHESNLKQAYPKLREVRVTYADGDVVETSMAAHLTDQDIHDYFKVGKYFNLGSGDRDNMQKVEKVEILYRAGGQIGEFDKNEGCLFLSPSEEKYLMDRAYAYWQGDRSVTEVYAELKPYFERAEFSKYGDFEGYDVYGGCFGHKGFKPRVFQSWYVIFKGNVPVHIEQSEIWDSVHYAMNMKFGTERNPKVNYRAWDEPKLMIGDIANYKYGGGLGELHYNVHWIEDGVPIKKDFGKDLAGARMFANTIVKNANVKKVEVRNHFKFADGGKISGTGVVRSITYYPIFDVESVKQFVEDLRHDIKAPYVTAHYSTLEGNDNVSVLLTISLDEKQKWENGIIENSRYAKFHIKRNGAIDVISASHTIPKRFRKVTVKNTHQAIEKINKYITDVNSPKAAPTTFKRGGEIDEEIVEFFIPDWALSSLINNDDSSLNDAEAAQIDKFVEKTAREYGNANFMLLPEEEGSLGFCRFNDIDKLAGNCTKLVLKSIANKKMKSGGLINKNMNSIIKILT